MEEVVIEAIEVVDIGLIVCEFMDEELLVVVLGAMLGEAVGLTGRQAPA